MFLEDMGKFTRCIQEWADHRPVKSTKESEASHELVLQLPFSPSFRGVGNEQQSGFDLPFPEFSCIF